jgi:hypothetical protein
LPIVIGWFMLTGDAMRSLPGRTGRELMRVVGISTGIVGKAGPLRVGGVDFPPLGSGVLPVKAGAVTLLPGLSGSAGTTIEAGTLVAVDGPAAFRTTSGFCIIGRFQLGAVSAFGAGGAGFQADN